MTSYVSNCGPVLQGHGGKTSRERTEIDVMRRKCFNSDLEGSLSNVVSITIKGAGFDIRGRKIVYDEM